MGDVKEISAYVFFLLYSELSSTSWQFLLLEVPQSPTCVEGLLPSLGYSTLHVPLVILGASCWLVTAFRVVFVGDIPGKWKEVRRAGPGRGRMAQDAIVSEASADPAVLSPNGGGRGPLHQRHQAVTVSWGHHLRERQCPWRDLAVNH